MILKYRYIRRKIIYYVDNSQIIMPGAYVIITTIPGMEREVLDKVADVPHVISAEGVYGDFESINRI